ncbi:MAG: ABC transporter ATP-binding protein [Alphaproteobacteria bacterium]|nr:ABC transporter ATP-binding protein [Alphaproteobacteria bacterium]
MNAPPATAEPLLALQGVSTHFFTPRGVVKAVDGVSWQVRAGETLGLVGESGCGKSVSALSVLQLIPDPPGRIVAGEIRFEGRDLLTLPASELRAIRGNQIAMIFQEPMTALNPLLKIGRQIGESVMRHRGLERADARARAAEMLGLVRIPDPERWLDGYPHQMSGGMRQRVMIAMALACGPAVLLADEPTTALDVTIQAQILGLIRELQARLGLALVLITHDLGVVAETADRVAVMYAGRIVEQGSTPALLERPRHPYTRGLLAAVPDLVARRRGQSPRRLAEIPGIVPRLDRLPAGCAFAPRCAQANDRCRRETPVLEAAAPDHLVACFEAERLVS